MTVRPMSPARTGALLLFVMFLAALTPLVARAAPYAAMVMDARSGEVLHSRNADTQLHPASLTKMMTLYIAFEAVERGEISLDTVVTIPAQAANEPPSRLGLRTGQRIRLRYLIRAAAVKSANDAATAIAFAISGSEAAFARRMNRTAQAMGMSRTHFKNAHGLTEVGHMSTARDMTILGRHMIYDWPEYYNLFSRRSTDAGIRSVNNTNRRFLDAYRGADGIKTGYTRAAGFNLVASAERGQERIIATMFGGSSTAQRNARVAELLNMGFDRAPSRVALNRPARPAYQGNVASDSAPVRLSENTIDPPPAGRIIRVSGAITRSLRPLARGGAEPEMPVVLVSADILEEAMQVAEAADVGIPPDATAEALTDLVVVAANPMTRPETTPRARPEGLVSLASIAAEAAAPPTPPVTRPALPPAPVAVAATEADGELEVITRISTSGGRHWGINVGRYGSRYQAERVLLRVALNEMTALGGALRRVDQNPRGFDANFMGLDRETAELACRRLQARGTTCFMIGPPGS